MRIKGKTKRVISCFLAMLTVASTVVQPMVTYAAESSDTSVPYYRDVKDQLDADEVVTAYD